MGTKNKETLQDDLKKDENIQEDSKNFNEDLDALVLSEESLSEDFREHAKTIFEAAINRKVAEEKAKLDEEFEARLEEETSKFEENLIAKVDEYISYFTEEYMTKNELAIDSGIKTEIAENFMNSIKEVFLENYIEIPEDKVDLVGEIESRYDDLKESFNSESKKNFAMRKEIELLRREKIINESSYDLSESEKEKLISLAENVNYGEDFSDKIKTLKESYIKKSKSASKQVKLNEETSSIDDENDNIETSTMMSKYVAAFKDKK